MADVARTIEAIWRMEAARIIGALARLVRDVGLAEELAQDALVAALEQWPREGVPDNPGAWLMMIAKRRAIDRFRRDRMMREKNDEIACDQDAFEDVSARMIEAHMDDDIGDERLALIFTACHPELGAEAQAALTLRLVGGLTPAEIARAFLTSEAAIQQRIVRAKKALRDAGVRFEVPHGPDRNARRDAVLSVTYLIFNEGHTATSGESWMRTALAAEALRLGRILSGLMPGDAEVLGLVALMELTAARFPARTGPGGEPVLLRDQNRLLWDRLLIRRGLAALDKARKTGAPAGPYRLQAEIAACHANAPDAAQTDWVKIAGLYDALGQVLPSPVVALNHAVALGMAFGPEMGLHAADALAGAPQLQSYHLLSSVRGEFLEQLGRHAEAAAAFEEAARLTGNEREKVLMAARAERCRAQL